MIFIRLEDTNTVRISETKKNAEGLQPNEQGTKGRTDVSRNANDIPRNGLEPKRRDNRKPKIIKRDIGKIGAKRRSSDEGDNDIPSKISRTANEHRTVAASAVSSAKLKKGRTSEQESKEDDIFDDLEDIDLDIGIEVEDIPKAVIDKVWKLFCLFLFGLFPQDPFSWKIVKLSIAFLLCRSTF